MLRFVQLLSLFILSKPALATDQSLNSALAEIEQLIAISKYQTESKEVKLANYQKCQNEAQILQKKYKDSAELIILEARCLAASIKAYGSANFKKLKKSKILFEQATKLNPKAYEGSAYANLGLLYGKAPGWPISFGDKNKAEQYFAKALEISANNLDNNFLYGKYLAENKKTAQALKYLKIAQSAPNSKNPIAQKGIQKEINDLISNL